MRYLLLLPALLVAVPGFPSLAYGQATTSVTANPSAVIAGASVGLTAIVQPNSGSVSPGKTPAFPTGTITFLDGITAVSNPATLKPNGLAGATFPATFGTPDPSLTTGPIDYNYPGEGELTGDLNGDGVPDLLIYAYSSSTGLSAQCFISNGKAGYSTGSLQTFSFSTPLTLPVPVVTVVPQLIDLNGDGKLDILSGLQVAYGNGDGTFAQPVSVSFLASGFVTSYAADLNGDGKTDILAVNAISTNTFVGPPFQFAVTSFLNQGGGTFTSGGTFTVATNQGGQIGTNFFTPAFVDLNGDGKPDLIAQTQTTPSGNLPGDPIVTVLLNNGDGTFGNAMPVAVPDPPNGVNTLNAYGTGSGDLNGDGKQDLVLTMADQNANLNAIILLGNGDGTFQSPLYLTLEIATPGSPYYQTPAVVVQDVNLDGKLDLVLGNGLLALGNGNGTFNLSSPFFPLQPIGETTTIPSFPLVQIELPGNLAPSLVYLLPAVTPPAVSVFTAQTSSSAGVSLTTLAVGTHAISARYSGDANYAANTSAAVTVTVTQAASATAAISSANPGFAGQSVTLTAKVTSDGPTPTGNVTFTTGSTALGTAPLSGGSATITTTSLTTVGTQTITASYTGDINTQASSATITQVVNAALSMGPGSGSTTTLTAKAGQTVSAPINVTGAEGFSGTVTFACSGLPAETSCSFSPASITVSGTTVVSTILSVNTAASATTSQLQQGAGRGLITVGYGLGLAGLVLLWPIRRRQYRLWAVLVCAFALAAVGLNGCSSGGSNVAKTTTGTYTFTVTASSGSLQTQAAYSLVVQ
jgi:hypothetical protein